MGLRSRSGARAWVCCVGLIVTALMAMSGSAAAAPKPISGKLSKPGYTVIAVAADGKVKAQRASLGRFRLTPPAERASLHLRAPNGVYAGPVVVGSRRKGKRAVVGLRAGARLGSVQVRRGYARVSKRLRNRWVDSSGIARARRGVPIGARVFGRVSSRPPRRPVAGDADFDGIADSLDIDDDGDLILDTVDRSNAARAAQVPPPPPFSVLPLLDRHLDRAANANHPALAAQIGTALPEGGRLIFGVAPPPGVDSAELDCAGDPVAEPPRPGLVYCGRGGTGRLSAPPGTSFPECCDADGDGFGTIPPFMGPPQLAHGATSDQIKTGDVLIARMNDANGVEVGAYTQLLPYVFATVPALVSYDDDGPGGAAPTELSYPYPSGTGQIPVRPRPAGDPDAGDVVVTLTFWRPQRARIAGDPEPQAGESAVWTDLGGLGYAAGLGAGECSREAFSEDDPNLTDTGSLPLGAASVFIDSRQPPDQPANPGSTLTLTMNMTRCLELQGLSSSFDEPGEVRMFHLIAAGGGRADQTLNVVRQ